jgi:hypothetical protein
MAAAALFAANHRLSFFSFLRTLCFECKRARSAGSTPADFKKASAASSSLRLRSSLAALAARLSAFSSARACRFSSAASGGGAAAASSSESLTSICWFAPSAAWNRQHQCQECVQSSSMYPACLAGAAHSALNELNLQCQQQVRTCPPRGGLRRPIRPWVPGLSSKRSSVRSAATAPSMCLT